MERVQRQERRGGNMRMRGSLKETKWSKSSHRRHLCVNKKDNKLSPGVARLWFCAHTFCFTQTRPHDHVSVRAALLMRPRVCAELLLFPLFASGRVGIRFGNYETPSDAQRVLAFHSVIDSSTAFLASTTNCHCCGHEVFPSVKNCLILRRPMLNMYSSDRAPSARDTSFASLGSASNSSPTATVMDEWFLHFASLRRVFPEPPSWSWLPATPSSQPCMVEHLPVGSPARSHLARVVCKSRLPSAELCHVLHMEVLSTPHV